MAALNPIMNAVIMRLISAINYFNETAHDR